MAKHQGVCALQTEPGTLAPHPPVALLLGDLRLRERAPGEAAPLSLMESGAEEVRPVASLSRRTLS